MKQIWLRACLILTVLPPAAPADSMEGMSGTNKIANGRFENSKEVLNPWTGVDAAGYLRKSVQMRGVNLHIDSSNQFDYGFMPNSASFVDMDGDGLPDIVAPDGAGIFWFWKNIGRPGNPQFGFGEVMPLLIDNERSTFRSIPELTKQDTALSDPQLRRKERIDKRRLEELERLQKTNEDRPPAERWAEEDLLELIRDEFPYPWENEEARLGTTYCRLNGYRQLRAIAAPCYWDHNRSVDFIVGDALGNIYAARNTGSRENPDFRTYRRSGDSLILKLSLDYNPIERRNEYRPVQFMNYAAPYVVDWNQNGTPDLLIGEGTYSTNVIRLYLDLPSADPAAGEFPQERVLYVGEERTFLVPSAWDWDGDGFKDLIVADGEGRITLHPNPLGKYRHGIREMEEYSTVEMEGDTEGMHRFIAPQPCDWNADGIMDFIWSGPFGRIFYSLGKEKGGVAFGPPTPVRSVRADAVHRFPYPDSVGLAAVPARGSSREGKGGTADAQRFYSEGTFDKVNDGGWPELRPWYGLMPNWDPDEAFERLQAILARGSFNPERFYRSGATASYAVAPVPYELFGLVEEPPSKLRGKGDRTLLQTWYDPQNNLVFKQPRDQVTKFGQAVSMSFENARGSKLDRDKATPEELDKWIAENMHTGNVRVSFYVKLEGDFSLMTVKYNSRHWNPETGRPNDGGGIWFHTVEKPQIGNWFQYQSIVKESHLPRSPGRLEIHFYGRGEVRIRDVAVADTLRNPTR
ncbi:MAG: VCBS repeat-containing protein [Opitutales bacterium]